jgi:hypothetical protein
MRGPEFKLQYCQKKKKETDLGETYERNRVIRKGAKENTDNLVLK